MRQRTISGLLTALLACAVLPPTAGAQTPLLVLEGDGLTIHVLGISEDETSVSGVLMRGTATFPFTGKMSSDGSVETVRGTFKAGDESFDFTSTQREDDDFVIFNTGNKNYRTVMKPVVSQVEPPEAQAAQDNLLAGFD